MNALEQQLLEQESGSTAPLLTVRTDTRIDVGLWWMQRPIHLCLFDNELLLFAVARRRYHERLALSDCQRAHYSPASGELVIESDPPLRFPRLKMPASTAIQVLAHLNPNARTPKSPTP